MYINSCPAKSKMTDELQGVTKDISKLGPSRGLRGRWWLLTLNNPILSFEETYQVGASFMRSLKYMTGQHEVGEKTGTPHYQFVIWSSEAIRPSAVHKAFVGAHVLFVNNPDKAIEYVTKERTRIAGPWEIGTRPVRRNNADDWQRIYDLARDNRIAEVPPEIQIKHMPNLIRIRDMFLKPKDAIHGKVRGLWIYGPPDTGKSYFARNYLGIDPVYPKTQSKWWDGYQQEKVVVLDDMDSNCLAHFMKIWTDVYAFIAEAKGTTVAPNHHVFVVTSNETIEEVFKDLKPDFIEAIRRRFTVVETHLFATRKELEEADFSKAVMTLHTRLRSVDKKGEFIITKENFIGPYDLSMKLCQQFKLQFRPANELPKGELNPKVDLAANMLEESGNEEAAEENILIAQERQSSVLGYVDEVTVVDENETEEIELNQLVAPDPHPQPRESSVLNDEEAQAVRDLMQGIADDHDQFFQEDYEDLFDDTDFV